MALEQIVEKLASRQQESNSRMRQLEREVKELRALASEPRAVVVPVATMEPEPYELTRTFEVVVQPDDDNYVATFFDANINASGETQQDAVANLKDLMIAIFERFSKEAKGKLGREPVRQLAILKRLLRKKS